MSVSHQTGKLISLTSKHEGRTCTTRQPTLDPIQVSHSSNLGDSAIFSFPFSLLLSLQRGDRALAGRKRALFVTWQASWRDGGRGQRPTADHDYKRVRSDHHVVS